MALLGYTRVSTVHQDDELQRDALRTAGVQAEHIYSDVVSGIKEARTRPGMQRLLGFARPGDTIVVWRSDRLDRYLLDVLATVHELRENRIADRLGLHRRNNHLDDLPEPQQLREVLGVAGIGLDPVAGYIEAHDGLVGRNARSAAHCRRAPDGET